MPHIEVRDVSLTYDTPGRAASRASTGASFDIEQSEFLCLVGPSAAAASPRCSTSSPASSRPPAARSASAASR